MAESWRGCPFPTALAVPGSRPQGFTRRGQALRLPCTAVFSGGSSTAGLFPTPSDPPRGCCGISRSAALLFLAVEVENPPGQGLSTLCALSVQVLDPELEVADLAFPPSTISASSLKMQVSGVGRSGDPSGEAAIPARHPVSRARRGQAWPGGGGG